MIQIINALESINRKIGNTFSWATLILVILIVIDVILRYAFKTSYIWLNEVEVYVFALIFLMGIGYTLMHDQHVRVDVFYEQWSPKRRAWVNLIGTCCLLIPWCVVAILSSWKYARFSLSFVEGSAQPGGLPFLFVLKFLIMLAFTLLLIQGIALMLMSILKIMKV